MTRNLFALNIAAIALAMPVAVAAAPASVSAGNASEKAAAVILAEDAEWSYFAALGKPEAGWEKGVGENGWKKGGLPIGYEMAVVKTIFTTMSEPSKKFPVAYFRTGFELPAGSRPSELQFRLGCDDGCIAYLNGVEIGRLRMAPNAPAEYGAEMHDWNPMIITIPAAEVKPGQNILAVEVHQQRPDSSDMMFMGSLTAQ